MSLVIISVVVILIVCTVLFLFEKYFSRWATDLKIEVVAIYFNFIGVLFTLLLAFVVVAAWEDYDKAVHTAEDEAHKLLYIYEDAYELSPEIRKVVQQSTMDYLNSIVKDEWENLNNPAKIKKVKHKFHQLTDLKRTLVASTDSDKDILAGIDKNLDDLKDLRHAREGFFVSHVPNLLWFVLFGGYLMCIFFSCLISFEKLYWKMIMTSLITFSMTTVLYLIFCLSNPYSGEMKVSSADYVNAIERINKIDSKIEGKK